MESILHNVLHVMFVPHTVEHLAGYSNLNRQMTQLRRNRNHGMQTVEQDVYSSLIVCYTGWSNKHSDWLRGVQCCDLIIIRSRLNHLLWYSYTAIDVCITFPWQQLGTILGTIFLSTAQKPLQWHKNNHKINIPFLVTMLRCVVFWSGVYSCCR